MFYVKSNKIITNRVFKHFILEIKVIKKPVAKLPTLPSAYPKANKSSKDTVLNSKPRPALNRLNCHPQPFLRILRRFYCLPISSRSTRRNTKTWFFGTPNCF